MVLGFFWFWVPLGGGGGEYSPHLSRVASVNTPFRRGTGAQPPDGVVPILQLVLSSGELFALLFVERELSDLWRRFYMLIAKTNRTLDFGDCKEFSAVNSFFIV